MWQFPFQCTVPPRKDENHFFYLCVYAISIFRISATDFCCWNVNIFIFKVVFFCNAQIAIFVFLFCSDAIFLIFISLYKDYIIKMDKIIYIFYVYFFKYFIDINGIIIKENCWNFVCGCYFCLKKFKMQKMIDKKRKAVIY